MITPENTKVVSADSGFRQIMVQGVTYNVCTEHADLIVNAVLASQSKPADGVEGDALECLIEMYMNSNYKGATDDYSKILHALQSAATLQRRVKDCIVSEYQHKSGATIEFRGNSKWCLKRDGFVLNKGGDFEYEPSPSNRDDEFLERCRFDSPQQALDTMPNKEPS